MIYACCSQVLPAAFVDSFSQEPKLMYCSNGCLCGYIARRVALTPAGEHRLFHRDSNARISVPAYGLLPPIYGYSGGLRLTQCKSLPHQIYNYVAMVSFAEAS